MYPNLHLKIKTRMMASMSIIQKLNNHCAPRFTRDVDIVLNLTKKSSEIFFAHFRNAFYLNEAEANKQIEKAGFFNAISFATGYKYDFILQQDREYEKLKF